MAGRRRSYQAVAWCYDEIAAFYSRGAIAASKAWCVEHFAAGDRVLFPGVGRGEDALRARDRGVRVTGIDLSSAMLRRLRRAWPAGQPEARLIHGDFFEHRASEAYDAVAAHFVLNVFDRDEMRRALLHMGDMVRPGGLLSIADFAPPPASRARRLLYAAHYRPVNVAAWCLGLCALHPLYDYTAELPESKWVPVATRGFAPFAGVPDFYRAWVARKR